MMKKNSKLLLFLFILFIAAVTASVFTYKYFNRTRFNQENVSGNSGGNYYNNGLFCEFNDKVYFSNPNDDYTLYEMTPQGTEAKRLTTDNVSFINADDNYLYYVRTNGSQSSSFPFLNINTNSLCRVKHNGKQHTFLDTAPSLYAALSGNYIYYIHYDTKTASTLYKVKIDGTEKQSLNKFPLLLSPASDGKLCYNGLDNNHNLYYWNSASDSSAMAFEGNTWNPVEDGSYLYFMDTDNDYHLTRVAKNDQQKTDISGSRVDCYNIYGNYAYYQKNEPSDQGMYRIALDGSSKEELIAEGIYCDINITSHYVYFRDFNNRSSFYQTPTNKPIQVTPFQITEAE